MLIGAAGTCINALIFLVVAKDPKVNVVNYSLLLAEFPDLCLDPLSIHYFNYSGANLPQYCLQWIYSARSGYYVLRQEVSLGGVREK